MEDMHPTLSTITALYISKDKTEAKTFWLKLKLLKWFISTEFKTTYYWV